MKKITMFILGSLIIQGPISLAQAFDPRGVWFTEGQQAKIELFNCRSDAKKLCGKIVGLREPNDPQTGKPKIDQHDYKGQPLIGLENVRDMEKVEGEDKWENGTIYDPKTGKTYEGNITMSENNILHLRGFVMGISLLGRTQDWTRTTQNASFEERVPSAK